MGQEDQILKKEITGRFPNLCATFLLSFLLIWNSKDSKNCSLAYVSLKQRQKVEFRIMNVGPNTSFERRQMQKCKWTPHFSLKENLPISCTEKKTKTPGRNQLKKSNSLDSLQY